MDRRPQLLGAFTLGVIVAAVAGCGDSTAYKTYTPEADAPASAATTLPAAADAPVSPVEPPATSEPIATAETAETPAAPVEPAADAAVAESVAPAEPAAPVEPQVELAAARPETIAPAPEANVTPASATEPDGTLIAAVGSATAVAAVKLEPLETKLLIPDKSFKREGDSLRVSYDDLDLLKVLNMEPVTANAPDLFPQWLKDLEGQRIRIRGYMRPGELAEELPFFVLARDTKDCCFGANSKAYDIIPVIMREGVTTDYIHLRPFDVVGEFHIGVEMDFANPERVEFMYRIEDAVVISRK